MSEVRLRDKQIKFAQMIGLLLNFAYVRGYGITFGDAYRDRRVFGNVGAAKGYGAPSSLHKRRLAVDLNLFKMIDGEWVYCRETEDHKELGEFWESIGGSWGGRFNDGNHYSLSYNGAK